MRPGAKISVVYKPNSSLLVFKNSESKKHQSKLLEPTKELNYVVSQSELSNLFTDLQVVLELNETFRVSKNDTSPKAIKVLVLKGLSIANQRPYLIVQVKNELVNEEVTQFIPLSSFKLFEKLNQDSVRVVL